MIAPGFVASGVASGIKASGAADLALVATEDARPVPAAGVFTQNLAPAAPVQISRRHLASTGGLASAVVLNSGNANASNGAGGIATAELMARLTADGLGCATGNVLVCSTGLIGIPLPHEPLEAGIPKLVAARSADGGAEAAAAIMTTDTVPKTVRVEAGGFIVAGLAKGAAMLAPNMATMLAVITTDAKLSADELHLALSQAVVPSFNAITIDGCTSTNDTVLVLASGRSGSAVDARAFTEALTAACTDLAEQMVNDAEGSTKSFRVTVRGAADDDAARAAARKVAQSQLVKCSFYGSDPYWGRVVSELATAGTPFDPDKVRISYGGVVVCEGGVAAEHDPAAVAKVMSERYIELDCDLGLGAGVGTILAADLTHAYIDENMGTS
ncbi:MAG: bifunctional glutamate N-acetyltransferase/amino-acid acetyltransferase ArgJ [Acidimicrobiia bacterium]